MQPRPNAPYTTTNPSPTGTSRCFTSSKALYQFANQGIYSIPKLNATPTSPAINSGVISLTSTQSPIRFLRGVGVLKFLPSLSSATFYPQLKHRPQIFVINPRQR